eukprot:RCo043320
MDNTRQLQQKSHRAKGREAHTKSKAECGAVHISNPKASTTPIKQHNTTPQHENMHKRARARENPNTTRKGCKRSKGPEGNPECGSPSDVRPHRTHTMFSLSLPHIFLKCSGLRRSGVLLLRHNTVEVPKEVRNLLLHFFHRTRRDCGCAKRARVRKRLRSDLSVARAGDAPKVGHPHCLCRGEAVPRVEPQHPSHHGAALLGGRRAWQPRQILQHKRGRLREAPDVLLDVRGEGGDVLGRWGACNRNHGLEQPQHALSIAQRAVLQPVPRDPAAVVEPPQDHPKSPHVCRGSHQRGQLQEQFGGTAAAARVGVGVLRQRRGTGHPELAHL